MGETFRKATSTRETALRSQAHQLLLLFRAMLIIGTAMRAMTTGRIPLKILMTTGLSLNEEKTMAIRRMATMSGRSSSGIHFLRFISLSMIGIMAYPPPIVKAPIFANTANICQSGTFFSIFLFIFLSRGRPPSH